MKVNSCTRSLDRGWTDGQETGKKTVWKVASELGTDTTI
jgi:hypothetical protein